MAQLKLFVLDVLPLEQQLQLLPGAGHQLQAAQVILDGDQVLADVFAVERLHGVLLRVDGDGIGRTLHRDNLLLLRCHLRDNRHHRLLWLLLLLNHGLLRLLLLWNLLLHLHDRLIRRLLLLLLLLMDLLLLLLMLLLLEHLLLLLQHLLLLLLLLLQNRLLL